MYSFGLLGDGLLFVVGLVWCSAMFRRWRSDLDELRTSKDTGDRVVIAFLWAVTAWLLMGMLDTTVHTIRGIGRI
jgi:hypothetical protein